MKLQISPYILTKRKQQNFRESSNIQEGALLRVTEGSFWGVADICTKPELGDPSLAEEIRLRGKLFKHALDLALEDLQARQRGVSLLTEKKVENNYLVLAHAEVDPQSYAKKTLKIKCGTDVSRLAIWLKESFDFEVSLRLDFNSCLKAVEFELFVKSLDSEIQRKIEYVEDPTPYTQEWSRWNKIVPLAVDFEKRHGSENFIQIFKPSREKIDRKMRYTLTSAMEHPVGFAHALRMAQKQAQGVSGFLTLDYYEETVFSSYFFQDENYVGFSSAALSGAGISMDQELKRLAWDGLE